jgi:hypothetical protein
MPVCGPSLFGTLKYIKVGNGQFVAIEGANTAERMIVSDLRIPYEQIYKSKFDLSPGQLNYQLKYLCDAGFNAIFVAIKVVYSSKSVIEEDNYLDWSYVNLSDNIFKLGKLLVLTGNSVNRVPELIISNPNTKYGVSLEVMVGLMKSEERGIEIIEIYATTISITSLTRSELNIKLDEDGYKYVEFTLVEENDEQLEKQRFSIDSGIIITGVKINIHPFGWTWANGNKESSADWFYDNFTQEIDIDRPDFSLWVYNGSQTGERKIRLYFNEN